MIRLLSILENFDTLEAKPPQFNTSLYDRFVLPRWEPNKPVLVHMNIALRPIIDLVRTIMGNSRLDFLVYFMHLKHLYGKIKLIRSDMKCI